MKDDVPIEILIQEAFQASHEIYCDFCESDFFESFPGLNNQEKILKHYIHTLSCLAAQQVEGELITSAMTEKFLETVQGFRLCIQDVLNLLKKTQQSLAQKEEAFAAYGKISRWCA